MLLLVDIFLLSRLRLGCWRISQLAQVKVQTKEKETRCNGIRRGRPGLSAGNTQIICNTKTFHPASEQQYLNRGLFFNHRSRLAQVRSQCNTMHDYW